MSVSTTSISTIDDYTKNINTIISQLQEIEECKIMTQQCGGSPCFPNLSCLPFLKPSTVQPCTLENPDITFDEVFRFKPPTPQTSKTAAAPTLRDLPNDLVSKIIGHAMYDHFDEFFQEIHANKETDIATAIKRLHQVYTNYVEYFKGNNDVLSFMEAHNIPMLLEEYTKEQKDVKNLITAKLIGLEDKLSTYSLKIGVDGPRAPSYVYVGKYIPSENYIPSEFVVSCSDNILHGEVKKTIDNVVDYIHENILEKRSGTKVDPTLTFQLSNYTFKDGSGIKYITTYSGKVKLVATTMLEKLKCLLPHIRNRALPDLQPLTLPTAYKTITQSMLVERTLAIIRLVKSKFRQSFPLDDMTMTLHVGSLQDKWINSLLEKLEPTTHTYTMFVFDCIKTYLKNIKSKMPRKLDSFQFVSIQRAINETYWKTVQSKDPSNTLSMISQMLTNMTAFEKQWSEAEETVKHLLNPSSTNTKKNGGKAIKYYPLKQDRRSKHWYIVYKGSKHYLHEHRGKYRYDTARTMIRWCQRKNKNS